MSDVLSFYGDGTYNQHIYITSDEEITGFENNIWVIKGERIFLWQNTMALVSNNKPKKIILTTDVDLIKDGVQAIDDEFLQWFVKNPSCEEVIVEIDYNKFFKKGNITISNCYEIIIPKEPKPIHQQIIDIVGGEDRFREIANLKPKQETLEQAYQRGYVRGLNVLIPIIENLDKEIIKLKRKGI